MMIKLTLKTPYHSNLLEDEDELHAKPITKM